MGVRKRRSGKRGVQEGFGIGRSLIDPVQDLDSEPTGGVFHALHLSAQNPTGNDPEAHKKIADWQPVFSFQLDFLQ